MFSPVITRFIRASCALLALCGAISLTAQDLSLAPITTGWRDAASFKRISEYFTGRENTGDIITLRTRPDQRSGYYFLLRSENQGAAVTVQIIVELNLPAEQQVRRHRFTTELTSGKTLVNLGLTGPDWPDAKTNPVAWKIEIATADGRVLATEKSYLWDKPAGK